MLTTQAGLWLMEQEGLGQILPLFMEMRIKNLWSGGRDGGRETFVLCWRQWCGGLENLVKGNQVATMSLHFHMVCV